MSGKGNCFDNSAVESCFKLRKAELVCRRNWQTRREVDITIFEYINGSHTPPQTLSNWPEIIRDIQTKGRLT